MNRRRKNQCRLLVILGLLLSLAVLVIYDQAPPRAKAVFAVGPGEEGSSPFVTTFPSQKVSASAAAGAKNRTTTASSVKTVLLWTSFFGSGDWMTTGHTFQPCAVKACHVTTEKEELGQADAVLMNVRNIYSPSDLPLVHPPHQIWIVHGSEPPYYVYLNLDKFNNIFNWTSWYRTDADIFSPYGHFTPLDTVRDFKTNNKAAQQPPQDDVFQPNFIDESLIRGHGPTQNGDHPLPDSFNAEDTLVEDPFALHDLLVYWMASSCVNYGQRYKLVSELQRLLPVDTYGSCGRLSCDKGSSECDVLRKRYKFVLAFENGYCRDYVTEKYWNAISMHQIPIVSGGADYAKLAIPGSYIDVDHFPSVELLAQHILQVGSDRRLYNSYFSWQLRYKGLSYGICNWCQLCAALHDDSKAPQVYSDFKGWLADDTCPLQDTFQHFRWLRPYLRFQLLGI